MSLTSSDVGELLFGLGGQRESFVQVGAGIRDSECEVVERQRIVGIERERGAVCVLRLFVPAEPRLLLRQ